MLGLAMASCDGGQGRYVWSTKVRRTHLCRERGERAHRGGETAPAMELQHRASMKVASLCSCNFWEKESRLGSKSPEGKEERGCRLVEVEKREEGGS